MSSGHITPEDKNVRTYSMWCGFTGRWCGLKGQDVPLGLNVDKGDQLFFSECEWGEPVKPVFFFSQIRIEACLCLLILITHFSQEEFEK